MSSSNPFALLAEDGDVSDGEQGLPKPSRPAKVDVAPPAGGKPQTRGNAGAGSIPGATARRSVPGQQASVKQTQARELPASDAPAGTGFERENAKDDRGYGRGGRGGRGRGGRGRGGAGARPPRGEAREARPDRRSATGISDSAKQEKQGWGGEDGKRELEAENAGVKDAAAESATPGSGDVPAPEASETAADPAATEAPAARRERDEEPEDNSQTYEEYVKAQKAAGRGTLDTLEAREARKANEGSDESQWKDGVAITKEKPTAEEDAYFLGTKKEKAAKNKERKEKTFLEVEFTSGPRPGAGARGGARGGRGRGGEPRGEGRGGRGRGAGAPRGAPRGGRGQSNGPNVDDSTAFPSLS